MHAEIDLKRGDHQRKRRHWADKNLGRQVFKQMYLLLKK